MKEYEKTGVLSDKDLQFPTEIQLQKGVAIIECIQEIPCNPCVAVCPVKAISMKDINALPKINYEKCTGCTKCVGICPGLAIFVIKVIDQKAWITSPYEFLPLPSIGDTVKAVDRAGNIQGDAKIIKVNKRGKTAVITIEVEKSIAMHIRHIKVKP